MNKSLLYVISKTHGQHNIFAGQDITANISGQLNKQIRIENPNNTLTL
jgi:translation initiation factor IF-1